MMNYLISIDDTDDVTKAVSTGKIAELIGQRLTAAGGTIRDGISRHQLLLSDEIPYTSHNSAMCIDVAFEKADRGWLTEVCEGMIKENRARISNPGLAICELGSVSAPDSLIQFGFQAKRMVKTKAEAYALAAAAGGVVLKELGGNGLGAIGALAGLGLRLSKSDGSLRGKWGQHLRGTAVTADEIRRAFGADMVVCGDGMVLAGDREVLVQEYVKLMLFDGKKCCIVRRQEDGRYVTVHQHQERESLLEFTGQVVCEGFASDNDEEEYVLPQGVQSCFNCLYRKWTGGGFHCIKAEVRADEQKA